jgi:putative endonuclease
MANQFYIYILYTKAYNKYYVGYSSDPWRRLEEHNTKPFNTFTSKYRPWTINTVFYCSDQENEAIRLERFIKKQKNRKLIEQLANPQFVPNGILAQLVRVPHPVIT